MKDFVLMSPTSGDWEAWYMEGKLIAEGHEVSAQDFLDAIADEFPNKVTHMEISDEKAEEGFSEDLSDMFI